MKLHPITENHLFKKAYTKGRRFVTPAVAVYVLPDYQAEKRQNAHPKKIRTNRVGLTVSVKLGGAVVRSRVRRIMRAAFVACCEEAPLKTGFLIVLVAREKAVDAKSTDLKRDLVFAFGKLDLIAP